MVLSEICNEVKLLVLDVGQFIKSESKSFDESKIVYKEFNNLVSYVDKGAEERLVDGLKKVLPEADFIAEEGTAVFEGKEFTWVIDPLDGTTNFSHGLPIYSISVALYQNERPVIGVVLEVNSGELFSAVKGGGAFMNDSKINVSTVGTLEKSLVATGFPYYMFDKLDNYFEILKSLVKKTHGIRRLGSAAVDLCYVACGRFESYFEFNLNPYDVGAGALIVLEAGGVVSNFNGEDKDWSTGKEIVASGKVHQEIIEEIKESWN